jgi:hypothetical protein
MNANSKKDSERSKLTSSDELPRLFGKEPESHRGLRPAIPDGGEGILSGQPRDFAGERSGTPAEELASNKQGEQSTDRRAGKK